LKKINKTPKNRFQLPRKELNLFKPKPLMSAMDSKTRHLKILKTQQVWFKLCTVMKEALTKAGKNPKNYLKKLALKMIPKSSPIS